MSKMSVFEYMYNKDPLSKDTPETKKQTRVSQMVLHDVLSCVIILSWLLIALTPKADSLLLDLDLNSEHTLFFNNVTNVPEVITV